MTRHGSFYPLPRELPSCQPVLFAYALDTPEQREALQQEILDRITAIQQLCGTLSMAQLDDADPRSHFGMVEAVALLSRDVHGMLAIRTPTIRILTRPGSLADVAGQ